MVVETEDQFHFAGTNDEVVNHVVVPMSHPFPCYFTVRQLMLSAPASRRVIGMVKNMDGVGV